MNSSPALSDEETDLLSPFPDIVALFLHYNSLYFNNELHTTSVQWSSGRMTSCAGTCESGNGAPIIKLSAPLMRYRTNDDLKDVLLHEMIHALLFTNGQNRRDGDHGPRFRAKMHEINASSLPDHQRPTPGYKLDVRHSWHAEVREHQKHHWRCQRCGDFIQRAMNRPPQEADCRARLGDCCVDPRCHFHAHKKSCGGEYIKVAEPEGYGDKKQKRKRKGEAPKFAVDSGFVENGRAGGVTLENFFRRIPKQDTHNEQRSPPSSTAQQAGGASSAVKTEDAGPGTPAIPGSIQKRVQMPAGYGHAGDNPEARRQRLLLAVQQRMEVMTADQPASSVGEQGPSIKQEPPEAQRAGTQPPSMGSAGPAVKQEATEALHAPQRRRRQPQPLYETGDGRFTDPVSLLSDSEETGKACIGSDGGLSTAESPGGVYLAGNSTAIKGESAVGEYMQCPICQIQWPANSITNAELNNHVDACMLKGHHRPMSLLT